MSTLGPTGPKPPSFPARTIILLVLVAIGGLLFGLVAQELRWYRVPTTSQENLQVAERDFQHGDEEEAFALFSKLANQNHPNAEYWLAHMTELGLGTPRDPQKAIELYKKAAGKNIVSAELRLGEIYLHGDLVPPDFAQAKSYLEMAAYHGSSRAAMLLGQMSRIGLGAPSDVIKAYAWSEVATLEGNDFAKRERDASLRNISATDQQAAIAQAKEIMQEIKQETAAPKPPHPN
jgi:TPR repeat protein